MQLGILLLIPFAMYFFLIRPQRRRAREAAGVCRSRSRSATRSSRPRASSAGSPARTDRTGSGSRSTTTCRSASPGPPSRARSATTTTTRPAVADAADDAAESGRLRFRRADAIAMRRRLWASLISTVVIVIVLFIGNDRHRATRRSSVSTSRAACRSSWPRSSRRPSDDLIVIRDLIRSELENQGIAEPDVRVQGQAIVVDLPGVKDQQEALDAVDVSGVVELRPVVEPDASARAAVTPRRRHRDHDRLRHGAGSQHPGDDGTATDTATTAPAATAPASTAPAGFRWRLPGPDRSRTGRRSPREPVTALPPTAPRRDRRRTAADPRRRSSCVSAQPRRPVRCSSGAAPTLTADNGWGVADRPARRRPGGLEQPRQPVLQHRADLPVDAARRPRPDRHRARQRGAVVRRR